MKRQERAAGGAQQAGPPVKSEPVDEVDGSYACLMCGESVRGCEARQCSSCSVQPWHVRCEGGRELTACPQCARGGTVVPWSPAGSAGGSRHGAGLVGERVSKYFPPPFDGFFQGTIVRYCPRFNVYEVKYDDGDDEVMPYAECLPLLLLPQTPPSGVAGVAGEASEASAQAGGRASAGSGAVSAKPGGAAGTPVAGTAASGAPPAGPAAAAGSMASEKWVSKGGMACELDTSFNAQKHAELCRYFLEPVVQDAGPQCVRACARARACVRALSVIPTRTHVTWAPCVRAILCRGFRHQHAPQHETPNAVGSLHHEGQPRATNVCVCVCVCVCVRCVRRRLSSG